jgi:hypothetical protein
MKLLFILIPLFSFIELYSPVINKTKDDNLIQNTNIRFDRMDFSKLEIKFYQVGCYNHDRFRMNFTKANNGFYINIYGYTTTDCRNLQLDTESSDKLLASRFIKNEEIKKLKDILTTDQTSMSTMFNIVNINYNGAVYRFHDNDANPAWRKYIYNLTSLV